MKYFTYLVIAAIIATAGYYLYQSNFNSSTISYVATVVDEIAELEIELAELEATITRGDLTEERAAEAKAAIVTRLETIASQARQAEDTVTLTSAQKTQLLAALGRLKNTLNTYSDTLVDMEGVVAGINISTASERVRRFVNKSNKSIQAVVTDTVTDIAASVQEIADEPLPEGITEIELDDSFAAASTDTGTSTPDMTSATSTATSTIPMTEQSTSTATSTEDMASDEGPSELQ